MSGDGCTLLLDWEYCSVVILILSKFKCACTEKGMKDQQIAQKSGNNYTGTSIKATKGLPSALRTDQV
jgi:hypothetical protein